MNIAERIQFLEGKRVEGSLPRQPAQHFGAHWGFVKVLSIARPPEQLGAPTAGLFQAQQGFVSGLHATDCPWGFLVTGDSVGTSVYFALPGSGDIRAIWEPRLSSCFPGCDFVAGEASSY